MFACNRSLCVCVCVKPLPTTTLTHYVHFYRCCTRIEHFSTIKFIGFNTIKLCGKLQANNWINYTIIYNIFKYGWNSVSRMVEHTSSSLLPSDAISSSRILFFLFATVQRCSELYFVQKDEHKRFQFFWDEWKYENAHVVRIPSFLFGFL